MKVRVTFNLGDEERRAIAYRLGLLKKAECASLILGLAIADLQVIYAEYDELDGTDKIDHCENCGCWKHLPRRCDTCECIWGVS